MGSLVYPQTSVSPAGAGTCTYTTTGSGDLNTITPTWAAGHGEYRNYRYTATPAAGYRFVRFEVTVDSIAVDWPISNTTQFNGTQSGNSWIYEPSAYDLEYWSNYWTDRGYALWWVDPDFPQSTGEVTAISVVAVFEAASTTRVTLDAQGGSGGTAYVDATLGLPMPSATMPTRSGYIFNGYFSGTNGTGTKYYNADGSSAQNWDWAGASYILYASWTANRYTIRLYADPQGGGQVSFDGTNYQDVVSDSVSTPTTYTLYARPTAGWRFVKFEVPNTWSSTDNPKTYTLDTGYVDIRAVFEQIPVTYYTVTTQARYAAGGIVAGGGTYAAGTVITLSATPNQGYQFSGWKSSAGSTESSQSFSYTVNSNVTWTAFFGTGLLIYFDRTGSGIDVPGDATVTIDFRPKLSTTLQVAPSWGSTVILTDQGVVDFPHSAIEGGSSFTVGLTASAAATVVMVIQQKNVASFTYQASLSSGVTTVATISASSGCIQGVN